MKSIRQSISQQYNIGQNSTIRKLFSVRDREMMTSFLSSMIPSDALTCWKRLGGDPRSNPRWLHNVSAVWGRILCKEGEVNCQQCILYRGWPIRIIHTSGVCAYIIHWLPTAGTFQVFLYERGREICDNHVCSSWLLSVFLHENRMHKPESHLTKPGSVTGNLPWGCQNSTARRAMSTWILARGRLHRISWFRFSSYCVGTQRVKTIRFSRLHRSKFPFRKSW